MNDPAGRLLNVLILKSIAEILLVGAVAVIFFIEAFPPFFRGWGEVTRHSIAGWAVNDAAPWDRVEVQLFIDGVFTASVEANQPRPDVLAAKWAMDQWHGYEFAVPPLQTGEHEARVYAMHA